jgi:hypothetical protein
MALDENIKLWADRIYQTDTLKYRRLIVWIRAAERTYAPTVIAAALELFYPHAQYAEPWWPYLDRVLDKVEAKTNAGNAAAESERRKQEIGELTAALLNGIRLRAEVDRPPPDKVSK